MPIRGPATGFAGGSMPSEEIHIPRSAATRSAPSNDLSMPIACPNRPGPDVRSRSRAGWRRASRIRSKRCSGSIARMSTPWPSPCAPQTAFAHQCMPYDKYTYRWPPNPNTLRRCAQCDRLRVPEACSATRVRPPPGAANRTDAESVEVRDRVAVHSMSVTSSKSHRGSGKANGKCKEKPRRSGASDLRVSWMLN